MTNRKPRLRPSDILADGRLALMLPLGFSAGLPFLLVFGALSAWLREAGISRTEIGLLSWIGFAYAWKFLWAPVIDRYGVPILDRWLGRRRSWMALAQVAVAVGLCAVAASDPKNALWVTIAAALLVAFASATQDVVIDGWRIDAAEPSRQGLMAAAYQLGYRLGLNCAGAGTFYIAGLADWQTAYLAMAALMSIGLLATIVAPRVEVAAARQNFSFATAVVEPFADLVRRKGMVIIPILALVALFRLPDFVAGVMANPLYIDLGFSMFDIANVSKLYGVWIGILGAFAGGLALMQFGLWTTLVVGAAVAGGSNLMFAWLAVEGARLDLLTLAISIDNFAAGFASSALIAYMSGLTSPGFAATQYALLSSLYALPGKFIGGFSGAVVDAFGYPALFTATAAIGIPLVILCLAVRRDTMATETANNLAEARATSAPRTPNSQEGSRPR